MTDLRHYLQDGANWQARCVMTYIQGNIGGIFFVCEDMNNVNKPIIEIGRYENCREQGYVFKFLMFGKNGCVCRNYAVYEHRNSDELIVLISNGTSTNTPNADFMWKDKGENASKYDYDKAFPNGSIVDCGEFILSDMEKLVREEIKKLTD